MKTLVILLAAGLVAFCAPVAVNTHLMNTYRQTLAHYLAKVVPPPTVFIGDSIMTGGMWFDDVRNINLASNGLITDQIAGNLKLAQAYNPKRIIIMAGMNDAIRGFDPEKLRRLWETVCKEPRIVVTMVTPSKHDELNRKINEINRIASEACRERPFVTLDVGDDSGRLRPELSYDNVHLNAAGYQRWTEALRRQVLISP